LPSFRTCSAGGNSCMSRRSSTRTPNSCIELVMIQHPLAVIAQREPLFVICLMLIVSAFSRTWALQSSWYQLTRASLGTVLRSASDGWVNKCERWSRWCAESEKRV
jgi:hypothetical protein